MDFQAHLIAPETGTMHMTFSIKATGPGGLADGKARTASRAGLWLAVGLLAAPFALAADDMQEPGDAAPASNAAAEGILFSHGIVVESEDGSSDRLMLSSDGNFESGTGTAGSWSLEAGVLCLVNADQSATCTVLPAELEPGMTWTTTDPDSGMTTRFGVPESPAGGTDG